MFRLAVARSAVALAMLSIVCGASAHAATLPALADVRAGQLVEAASFRRLVASRYDVQFNRVVAADIDRDGDIDVIATTDRAFTIWVNDGTGHLTSQRPSPGPAIDARAPGTWRDGEQRSDPSANDGAPVPQLVVARAHAPPAVDGRVATSPRSSGIVSPSIRFSAPRGPPL
jgi:hypothetical protein